VSSGHFGGITGSRGLPVRSLWSSLQRKFAAFVQGDGWLSVGSLFAVSHMQICQQIGGD